MGGRGSAPPLENHKWLFVSLEILVRTPPPPPPEKQLDLSGPIASRGRSIRLSMKNVDDQNRTPAPDRSVWNTPCSEIMCGQSLHICTFIYDWYGLLCRSILKELALYCSVSPVEPGSILFENPVDLD